MAVHIVDGQTMQARAGCLEHHPLQQHPLHRIMPVRVSALLRTIAMLHQTLDHDRDDLALALKHQSLCPATIVIRVLVLRRPLHHGIVHRMVRVDLTMIGLENALASEQDMAIRTVIGIRITDLQPAVARLIHAQLSTHSTSRLSPRMLLHLLLHGWRRVVQ